ncbi:MAG: hypothetical protein QOE20_746 [Mycobacterium sp.]|nr:hypothetical protein [Mycobacterium sp.]
MPPDASKTKATLLDSAARAFARDGVFNASLIDITRQAGQRNRAALSYHFGSRDGILCAVLDRHAPFLARREGELLDIAMPTTSPTSPNTGRNFWRHPSSGPRPFGWPIPSTSSSTSNTPSSSAIRLARSRPFMPPVIANSTAGRGTRSQRSSPRTRRPIRHARIPARRTRAPGQRHPRSLRGLHRAPRRPGRTQQGLMGYPDSFRRGPAKEDATGDAVGAGSVMRGTPGVPS